MMTSAVFIGLLIALLFLCLLFVTAPWWGSQMRAGWMPIGLSAFVLIFSVTWYWVEGRSAHIFYEKEDATLQQIAVLLEDTVPMPEVVRNKIDSELEKQKNRAGAQPTVWLLQAQLAMQHQDYIKAKEAYESAHKMFPDEIDVSVSYAQAWYLSQDQVVTPELETFLEQLKKQDATQTGLINLLAVIAFHNGDYKQAISYWNELIPLYPENSSEALTLKAAVIAAKSKINK
jgi:tetratricopeptide (TPR) repeat protein